MISGRVPYRLLPHTADAAFEVDGPDLPRLFEAAASVLFDLMVEVDRVACGPLELAVEAEAPDREALLVAWLSELLGEAMARQAALGAFEVERLDATRVVGRAWGERLDLARHGFKTEVKAVTYHELALTEIPGGFRAHVVVDI
ncbi:MAG: archease [Acidobacteria bacterium]|jgi:SHS2 domain-containing protein|nr:archease [Acidobacteriota bacterium]